MAALVHVGVEAGEGDPPDAGVLAVGADGVDDLGLGLLVFELDFVANDGDDVEFGGIGGGGGLDLETDGGAFLAADAFDDAVEFHVDDVFEFVFALGDGDNTVIDFEFAAAVGGSAGDEFDNFGVAILAAQDGADTDEGEAHLDVEVVERALAHVFGVRVVALGEGGEKGAGLVLAGFFLEGFEEALVALADGFDGGAFGRGRGGFGRGFGFFVLGLVRTLGALLRGVFLKGAFGDDGGEEFGFDAVGPDAVGFGFVGGPRLFVPVDLRGAIAVEGEFLTKELVDFSDAGFDAGEEAVVDVVGGLEVAAEDVFVEPFAVFGGELVDVGLGEEEAVVVEEFEVAVEGFAGLGNAGFDLVVEALPAVVGALEHAGDGLGDLAEAGVGIVLGGSATGGDPEQSSQNKRSKARGFHEIDSNRSP